MVIGKEVCLWIYGIGFVTKLGKMKKVMGSVIVEPIAGYQDWNR